MEKYYSLSNVCFSLLKNEINITHIDCIRQFNYDLMKKIIYISEGILQIFIGFGAVVCGFLMIINPDGSILNMPLSILNGSPFQNYLIPGLILLTVNGLGNMYSGILSFRKHKYAGFTGIIFGMGLMIWIFVQVSMIGGGHWLQYLYFVLGLIETLLGFEIREIERKQAL
jgi:hypothetical protein